MIKLCLFKFSLLIINIFLILLQFHLYVTYVYYVTYVTKIEGHESIIGHLSLKSTSATRVHNPKSATRIQTLKIEVFKEQEDEKKREYLQRVLDVEMGSFTPLVFGTNGGMGNECQRFLKHLADKIAQKDTEPYSTVIVIRSVHACVRG